MEERDQILIERYLAGELTAAEHLDVEQREKEDPLFRQSLLDYSIARKALGGIKAALCQTGCNTGQKKTGRTYFG